MDERCFGEKTWSRGEQNSVIDYILCNEKMYKYFSSMNIDENRDIFDNSDHNFINVDIRYKEEMIISQNKQILLNKKGEEDITKYINHIKSKVEQTDNCNSIEDMNVIIKEAEGKFLKIS